MKRILGITVDRPFKEGGRGRGRPPVNRSMCLENKDYNFNMSNVETTKLGCVIYMGSIFSMLCMKDTISSKYRTQKDKDALKFTERDLFPPNHSFHELKSSRKRNRGRPPLNTIVKQEWEEPNPTQFMLENSLIKEEDF